MTAVLWDSPGEKVYEVGLDRAIIYTDTTAVPWNGLTSVDRDPFIASIDPLYLDGVKYADKKAYQPLSGTISAYTYPDELLEFQGLLHVFNGMYFNEQPTNKTFGLSYRTRIGNDLEGIDHGYKLHLVYNVSVVPSNSEYETLSEDVDPTLFSWGYSTIPVTVQGYRPLSHLEIDSRKTPPGFMEHIEGILYGTSGEDPRQPSLTEMLYFMYYGPGVTPPSTNYPSSNTFPGPNFYPGGSTTPPSTEPWPSGSTYPGSSLYPGGSNGAPSHGYTVQYLAAY